jgi:hypothetical protein
VALGKGLFAGPAVPSALCREFPTGTACAERNCASAESKVLSAEPWNPVVTMLQPVCCLPIHTGMPYICHYAASLCSCPTCLDRQPLHVHHTLYTCARATTSCLVLEQPIDEQNLIDLSRLHLRVVVGLV